MNFRLTPTQLAHLRTVGVAIDGDQRPSVFDGGVVGFNNAVESEVISDAAQWKPFRPAAGSRPRQRAWSSRAHASGDHLSSEALEDAYGAGFRILAQHYEALAFEDDRGLWVAAKSQPLGRRGPQVHFLVAFPLNRLVAPRAWAFEEIGPKVRLASLKHTNFPDASICAYIDDDDAWPNPDGLVGLIDIFSIWMLKKWHRSILGWWPGKQVGACALYRRREFDGREKCGCGSNRRYRDCHQGADLLLSEPAAQAEFRRLFACEYGDRRAPDCVIDAARTYWRRMPPMATAFAHSVRNRAPVV